jgi:hypothetical protein
MYKTTDKYFINYGKKSYRFSVIGLMLDNLSEHQIEALSNLLRGNDCFISQPTRRSGKSDRCIISLYFRSLLYEAFQLLRSNDVHVEPKTQEIV